LGKNSLKISFLKKQNQSPVFPMTFGHWILQKQKTCCLLHFFFWKKDADNIKF
jgi:hypothetical protein